MRPRFIAAPALLVTLLLSGCFPLGAPLKPVEPLEPPLSDLDRACDRLLAIDEDILDIDQTNYLDSVRAASAIRDASQGVIELASLTAAAQRVVTTAVPLESTTPAADLRAFADASDRFVTELTKLDITCG